MSASVMSARSHLVAITLLAAGCPGDLSMADSSTGDSGTTSTPTTSTSSPTTGAPTCGDGQLDPGEQCDDGNSTPGDGCENNCTTTPGELCGNGTTDPGEDCDDGNQTNGDGCEGNCKLPVIPPSCGDSVVDPGEQCDDGNDDDTDECTSACKNASCGDGFVHSGVEECDGGGESVDCDADCTPVECGDQEVNEAAGEECEDGNADDTDACTSACKNASCGDGFVQAGKEECDDGTPDGDDLCNVCKVSPHRYIFVTAGVFDGDFTGVAGADATCVFAAGDADIPGAADAGWVAWLSMNSSQAVARIDTTFTGWYVLPTNPPTLVAKGWTGLTSGTLMHAIDHTEMGEPVPAPETVWTNTDVTGMLPMSNIHCMNWDSANNQQSGRVGLSSAVNGDWTNPAAPASATCDSEHHLYCLQDLP